MNHSTQNTKVVSVEVALTYLRYGWSVIPVALQRSNTGKISKRPAVRWQEFQHRRPTEHELWRWFGSGKYAGIGVVTGRISKLVVIDIEHDAAPADAAHISSPLESQTISGGKHVFYRWTKPLKNSVRIQNKPIDFRGDGGFVVLPPSQLGEQQYLWMKKLDLQALPALPENIEQALIHCAEPNRAANQPSRTSRTSKGRPLPSSRSIFPKAQEGSRNTSAAKVSGLLCANMSPKLWEEVGWQALCAWNISHCFPPLEMGELRNVWNSITSAQLRQRRHKVVGAYR